MEEMQEQTIKNMDNKITKRIATEADTEFARRTHHAAYHDVIVRQFGGFDEKIQDDFFAKSWTPENHEIVLDDGLQVGYCSIERLPDRIAIHELVLLPAFQGKGIGSKILREVLEEAKARSVPVRLQVLKENQAQHLYRTLGFKDSGFDDTHIQMEYKESL